MEEAINVSGKWFIEERWKRDGAKSREKKEKYKVTIIQNGRHLELHVEGVHLPIVGILNGNEATMKPYEYGEDGGVSVVSDFKLTFRDSNFAHHHDTWVWEDNRGRYPDERGESNGTWVRTVMEEGKTHSGTPFSDKYPDEPLKLYDLGKYLVEGDPEALAEFYRLRDEVSKIDISKMAPNEFLDHYAWVVYVAGFKEDVIDEKWDDITEAFQDFEPEKIDDSCIEQIMPHFANRKKAEAILKTARLLKAKTWRNFTDEFLKTPSHMQKLPYIGPVTCFHLARNLGMNYAKPDRHLSRLARHCGYGDDVQGMCEFIAKNRKETVPCVDYVLWYLGEQKGTDRLNGDI